MRQAERIRGMESAYALGRRDGREGKPYATSALAWAGVSTLRRYEGGYVRGREERRAEEGRGE